MLSDFASLVTALTLAASQLAEGSAGTTTPLLPTMRGELRTPIEPGSIVQELCRRARQLVPP